MLVYVLYDKLLQFGHSREAVESPTRRRRRRRRGRSFNSATAVRLWSLSVPAFLGYDSVGLQFGHSREAVESTIGTNYTNTGILLQFGHSREAVESASGTSSKSSD